MNLSLYANSIAIIVRSLRFLCRGRSENRPRGFSESFQIYKNQEILKFERLQNYICTNG